MLNGNRYPIKKNHRIGQLFYFVFLTSLGYFIGANEIAERNGFPDLMIQASFKETLSFEFTRGPFDHRKKLELDQAIARPLKRPRGHFLEV